MLVPLGLQRFRLIECLGGNNARLPGWFDFAPGEDMFAAYRTYVARLASEWAHDDDDLVVRLVAAARLLAGERDAARVLVDRLPRVPIVLDHGAGFCPVAPFHALSTALPLPPPLADSKRWLAGTPEQAALRTWLDEHLDKLEWHDVDAVYRFPSEGRRDTSAQ